MPRNAVRGEIAVTTTAAAVPVTTAGGLTVAGVAMTAVARATSEIDRAATTTMTGRCGPRVDLRTIGVAATTRIVRVGASTSPAMTTTAVRTVRTAVRGVVSRTTRRP